MLNEELQNRVYRQQTLPSFNKSSGISSFKKIGFKVVALQKLSTMNDKHVPSSSSPSDVKQAIPKSGKTIMQRQSSMAMARGPQQSKPSITSPARASFLQHRSLLMLNPPQAEPEGPKQLPTKVLVRCLAQLDGVAEVKARLRYYMRVEVG